jgi:transcriptional regulator with GAF, ATPase, and Fis domain
MPLFARRGFTPDEARRYFAIFYQIRRAFHFIHRGLVGTSDCMKQLRRHLWNNVFTHDIRLYERHLWNRMEDFSTVLLGETGTGKGTAAAAIGRSGFIPFDEKRGGFAESFTRSFIALNLSQFPETLIESELFGHKKGAFTGAVESHEGVFARCSPFGAIFLDEVGEVSVPVQIKLLQVLQERTFSPVGGHEKLRFRGRVIAATNKPLDQLRGGGQFRDDFFYRLCSDVITVPPLRQRIQEDPRELNDLIGLILQRLTGETSVEVIGMVRGILDSSLGKGYAWPGNVRELEQAVRRILLTRHYEGDHKAITPDLRSELVAGIESGALDADAVLSGYCRLLHERHGTYEEVARRTNLDRRTVKAYLAKRQR